MNWWCTTRRNQMNLCWWHLRLDPFWLCCQLTEDEIAAMQCWSCRESVRRLEYMLDILCVYQMKGFLLDSVQRSVRERTSSNDHFHQFLMSWSRQYSAFDVPDCQCESTKKEPWKAYTFLPHGRMLLQKTHNCQEPTGLLQNRHSREK